MSRKVFHGRVVLADSSVVVMLLLAGCFLLGALAGHHAAGQQAVYQSTELQEFFCSFLLLLQEGKIENAPFGYTLFSYCKYPIVLFCLGLVPVGVFLIPAFVAYQGFMTSFAVSAVLYAAGEHSVFLAVLFFGLRCLVTLPCCFFLANAGMASAAKRLNKRNGRHAEPVRMEYTVLRFAVCILILFTGALLEHLFLVEWLYAVL